GPVAAVHRLDLICGNRKVYGGASPAKVVEQPGDAPGTYRYGIEYKDTGGGKPAAGRRAGGKGGGEGRGRPIEPPADPGSAPVATASLTDPKTNCLCADGDLMCKMKCSARK